MKNSIAFALFGDGKFISWTYGLFVQLTDRPKVYPDTEEQIQIVVSNFKTKIRKLHEVSELGNILPQLILIDSGQNKDKEQLSQYKEFELKMYTTDFYDGPDPEQKGKWIYYTDEQMENWIAKVDLEKFDRVFKYEED